MQDPAAFNLEAVEQQIEAVTKTSQDNKARFEAGEVRVRASSGRGAQRSVPPTSNLDSCHRPAHCKA